jgi:hypothetical protein
MNAFDKFGIDQIILTRPPGPFLEFWQEHRDWYDESFANHVDAIYRDRGYSGTNANKFLNVDKD